MKVYLSSDLEGIGGILIKEQTTKGTPEYNEACRLLSMEVYSLIDGLVEAGVDEVVVYDAHGSGINIQYDYMHPRARYLQGYSHPEVRFPFLDETFDFMILQGYHAMAGTEKAILDHSYSSVYTHNIYVNGRKSGEIYIDALVASELKVPVAMVTGDDKAVSEALDVMPWAETYVTKQAIARSCALITPPAVVRENIKKLARGLVQKRDTFKLLDVPSEIEIRHETAMSSGLDGIAFIRDDVVRADGRTIIKRGSGVWSTLIK
jgi:D-aminopeptidase